MRMHSFAAERQLSQWYLRERAHLRGSKKEHVTLFRLLREGLHE